MNTQSNKSATQIDNLGCKHPPSLEKSLPNIDNRQAGNKPVFGSARGMITMADDFDKPFEDFEEYM